MLSVGPKNMLKYLYNYYKQICIIFVLSALNDSVQDIFFVTKYSTCIRICQGVSGEYKPLTFALSCEHCNLIF